jgi:hypothetical protein
MNLAIFANVFKDVIPTIFNFIGQLYSAVIKGVWPMLFHPLFIKIIILAIFIEILHHLLQSNTKKRGFRRY